MGTPVTPSNSTAQCESPAPKSGALSILGDVSQYTILVAFALYVIGFVIWQTYLGDYGISSLSLLQTEYFSAALCFLGFFLYFGFPTALIYLNWFRKNYVKSTDENKFWTIESVPLGLFLWTGVSICYRLLFSAFDNHSHEIIRRITVPLMVFFILSSIAWLVLYVKLKERKSKWADILKKKLNPGYAMFFIFFLLTLVELLMQKENLDQLYFVVSVCFTALGLYFAELFTEQWKKVGVLGRSFMCLGFVLAFLFNVACFAGMQFGKIPKSIGGGKPATAYIKFSDDGKDLGRDIGLPLVTNMNLLIGFYGPVSVLKATEKEIVIINTAEANLKEFQAFTISQAGITNFVKAGDTTINIGPVPRIIGTNTVGEFSKTIGGYINDPSNPVKLTAKQIRADLINAIIYVKPSMRF